MSKVEKAIFYTLSTDVKFSDERVVYSGTKLKELIVEDEMVNVETVDDDSMKIVFWVKKEDLTKI